MLQRFPGLIVIGETGDQDEEGPGLAPLRGAEERGPTHGGEEDEVEVPLPGDPEGLPSSAKTTS